MRKSVLFVLISFATFVGVEKLYAEVTQTVPTNANAPIEAPSFYEPDNDANKYLFANGARTLDTYYLFNGYGEPYFDKLYLGQDIYEAGYLIQSSLCKMAFSSENYALTIDTLQNNNGFTYLGRRPKLTREEYIAAGINADNAVIPTDAQYENPDIFEETTDGMRYTWSKDPIKNYYGYHHIKRIRTFNATVTIKWNIKTENHECNIRVDQCTGHTYTYTWDLSKDEYTLKLQSLTPTDVTYQYMETVKSTGESASITLKPTDTDVLSELTTDDEFKETDGLQGFYKSKYAYNITNIQGMETKEGSGRITWLGCSCSDGEYKEEVTKETKITFIDDIYVWGWVKVNNNGNPILNSSGELDFDIDHTTLGTKESVTNVITSNFNFSEDDDTKCINLACTTSAGYSNVNVDYGFVPTSQWRHLIVYATEKGVLQDYYTITKYPYGTQSYSYNTRQAAETPVPSPVVAANEQYDKTYTSLGNATISRDIESSVEFGASFATQSGTQKIGTTQEMLVYEKDEEHNTYKYVNNQGKKAQGRPVGQKIYITGSALNLDVNTQQQNIDGISTYIAGGWMEPVNSEVYLDGVELQCTPATTEKTLSRRFVINTNSNITDKPTRNWDDAVYSHEAEYTDQHVPHRSVFYLVAADEKYDNVGSDGLHYTTGNANTTSFHVKGKNYLAGNTAGRIYMQVRVDVVDGKDDMTALVNYRFYVHSSPIQIKDERAYYKWRKGAGYGKVAYTCGSGTNANECPSPNTEFNWRKERDGDDPLPSITCKMDAVWADGKIQEYAYLDLTAQPTAISDDLGAGDKGDRTSDMAEFFAEPLKKGYYIYTPPLYTGGEHGKFVIDGGQVNLWPAKVYVPQFSLHFNKARGVVNTDLNGIGGYANYMACGGSKLKVNVNAKSINLGALGLFASTLSGALRKLINDLNATVSMTGIGTGNTAGALEVNAGTVTAQDDPKSFASRSTGHRMKNHCAEIANLFVTNNLQINGGSFPGYNIYAISDHGIVEPYKQAASDYINKSYPVNKFEQVLTKTDLKKETVLFDDSNTDAIKLSEPNHDYSIYDFRNLDQNKLDARAFLVNDGTANAYYYGMQNVVTTDQNIRARLYLPANATKKWVMNYNVTEGGIKTNETNPIAHQSGNKIYQLSIYDNVAMNPATPAFNNVPAYRIAYYKTLAGDSQYYGLCLPYEVQKVTDINPWGVRTVIANKGNQDGLAYGAYVEEEVKVADWENPHTWYWQYHFNTYGDDGNPDNVTYLAENHEIRDSYTTHTRGDFMVKGVPYVIKFSGEDWADDKIEYMSQEGWSANQLNSGAATNGLETSYTSNITYAFKLAANLTLYPQKVTFPCYILARREGSYNNQVEFYSVDANSNYTLQPFEIYLLPGSAKAAGMPQLRADAVDWSDPDIVSGNAEIVLNNALIVTGSDHELQIWAAQAQAVRIYNAAGILVTEEYLPSGETISVPVATGMYIVKGANTTATTIVK